MLDRVTDLEGDAYLGPTTKVFRIQNAWKIDASALFQGTYHLRQSMARNDFVDDEFARVAVGFIAFNKGFRELTQQYALVVLRNLRYKLSEVCIPYRRQHAIQKEFKVRLQADEMDFVNYTGNLASNSCCVISSNEA